MPQKPEGGSNPIKEFSKTNEARDRSTAGGRNWRGLRDRIVGR